MAGVLERAAGAEPCGGLGPYVAGRLEEVPGLADEVKTARSLGISYRRFAGWEPTEETTYHYDDGGRLVRAVTTREAEWDDHERAWMLGLAEYERRAICPSCGGLASDCQSPENEHRWRVGPPVRCHRTTAVEQAAEAYKDAPAPRALMFAATLPGDA